MSRLIDADKLKRVVMSWENPFNAPATYNRVRVITAINEAPTVDAEPTIRCKDCKYWKKCIDEEYCSYWEEYCWIPAMEDDFCSRGEHK